MCARGRRHPFTRPVLRVCALGATSLNPAAVFGCIAAGVRPEESVTRCGSTVAALGARAMRALPSLLRALCVWGGWPFPSWQSCAADWPRTDANPTIVSKVIMTDTTRARESSVGIITY